MDADDPIYPAPPGADLTKPSTGRLYDYFLNGNAWYPVDKAAGDKVVAKVPEVYYMANANRVFLQRAAGFLARAGIDQFLDLGAGLPTQWNTHEVAQTVNPNTRVVYVDHDPVVVAHARQMLEDRNESNVTYLEGDVREPESILNNPQVHGFLDFNRPIAMMQVAIWHFVTPEEEPYALVGRYMDAVVPGSYLALSHVTADGQDHARVQTLTDVYSGATSTVTFRTFQEIEDFFDGLEFTPPYEGAEPGLSYVDKWGSKAPDKVDRSGTWLYAGVARKR